MVYFLILLYLIGASIVFDLYSGGRKNSATSLRFIFFILIIVASFRYRLAPDSVYYEYYVDEVVLGISNLTFDYLFNQRVQALWVLASSISKSMGGYLLLQVAVSTFVLFTVYRFFKNFSKYTHTATLMFYIVFYHYFTMEILRESVAISLFVWAVILSKDKPKLSILSLVTSVLFHKFAVVVFPLYILVRYRFSTKYVFIYSAAVVLLFIALRSPLKTLQMIFVAYSPSLDLSFYEVEEGLSVFGYAYNITRAAIPLLAIVYSIRKVQVMQHAPQEKQYFISLSLVFVSLVIIRITSIPFIERIMNYVILFVIVLSAEALVYLLRAHLPRLKLLFGTVIYLLLTVYSVIPLIKVNQITEVPTYARYYPYYSYVSGRTDPQREYLIRVEAKEP